MPDWDDDQKREMVDDTEIVLDELVMGKEEGTIPDEDADAAVDSLYNIFAAVLPEFANPPVEGEDNE